MSEEQKTTERLRPEELLKFIAVEGTKPEKIKQLREQPGSRVRIFDHFSKTIDELFPEGTEGGNFYRNAKAMLEGIRPPFTEETVKKLYEIFEGLDNDIKDDPRFKAFIEKFPPDEQAQMRKDILSAYRFKLISKTQYYDVDNLNQRQQDFLQLCNIQYRENPGQPTKAFEILRNTSLESSKGGYKQDIGQLVTMPDPEKIVNLIFANKFYNYLPKSQTTDLIVSACTEKNVDPTAILKTLEKYDAFALYIDKVLNSKDVNPEEKLSTILTSDEYKNLNMDNANEVLQRQLSLHANAEEREKLLQELPGRILPSILKQTYETDQRTPDLIMDSIRSNKFFRHLETRDSGAANTLLKEAIDGISNPDRKQEVQDALLQRLDSHIKKALVDDKKSMPELLEILRGTRNYPLLDEKQIQQRVYEQVLNSPDMNKARKTELITALNELPGNDFAVPKSKLDIVTEKVGGFFRGLGKLIEGAWKTVKDTVSSLVGGGQSTPETTTVSPKSPETISTISGPELVHTSIDRSQHIPIETAQLDAQSARNFSTGSVEEKFDLNRKISLVFFKSVELSKQLDEGKLPEKQEFNTSHKKIGEMLEKVRTTIEKAHQEGKISSSEFDNYLGKVSNLEKKLVDIGSRYTNKERELEEEKDLTSQNSLTGNPPSVTHSEDEKDEARKGLGKGNT